MHRPTVAILGASADRKKFGNKSVRAHVDQGYEVYPIHPTAEEIEGLKVYRRLADVPADHLDRISIYLPPPVTLKVLEEVAAKKADEVWLNPGAEDEAVLEKAQALGLEPIQACSIVNLGVSPRQFAD